MKKQQLGKTGKYPSGKLTNEDEGELKLGIVNYKNKVVIEFGKPTHWIGLDKNEAINFANAIINNAKEII